MKFSCCRRLPTLSRETLQCYRSDRRAAGGRILDHSSLQSIEASDVPHDECGVIGVYLPQAQDSDAALIAFYGLYALQHRGQESAGIAASDGRTLRNFTNVGLVSSAFRQEDLDRLPGHLAIGHTRYSTTGSTGAMNAQPIVSQALMMNWQSVTTGTSLTQWNSGNGYPNGE